MLYQYGWFTPLQIIKEKGQMLLSNISFLCVIEVWTALYMTIRNHSLNEHKAFQTQGQNVSEIASQYAGMRVHKPKTEMEFASRQRLKMLRFVEKLCEKYKESTAPDVLWRVQFNKMK